MKSRSVIHGLTGLTLAALLASSMALAATTDCPGAGRMGGGPGGGRMGDGPGAGPWQAALSELSLTSEQQTAIDKLLAAGRDQRADFRAEMQDDRSERHAAMMKLLNAETFDETAAQALIAEQQKARADQQLAMMKLHHQIAQLLTEEQRTQLVNLLDQQAEMRGGKFGRGQR